MSNEVIRNRRKFQTLVEELTSAYERIDELEDFVQQQFSEAKNLLPSESDDNEIDEEEEVLGD